MTLMSLLAVTDGYLMMFRRILPFFAIIIIAIPFIALLSILTIYVTLSLLNVIKWLVNGVEWLRWLPAWPEEPAMSTVAITGALASLISGFVVTVVAYLSFEHQRSMANREHEQKKENAISDIPYAMYELISICNVYKLRIRGYNNSRYNDDISLSDLSLAAIQLSVENTYGRDRNDLRKILVYYKIIKTKFEECEDEKSQIVNNNGFHIQTAYTDKQKSFIKLVISLISIAESHIDSTMKGSVGFCRNLAQRKYRKYTREFNYEFTFKGSIDFDYDYSNDNVDTGFLNPRYLEKRYQ